MLIIPIINNNKIKQVKIEFLKSYKTHERVNYKNIDTSDVILGSNSFKKSSYNTKNQSTSDIVDFIRTSSIHTPTNFLVSTKFYNNEHTYDLYQLELPPKKITIGLDNLYSSIILDLKNCMPDVVKGKYIDLEKIGITKHITDEKLELLQFIASNLKYNDGSNYQKILKENDLDDLIETLKFIELFYCEIIPNTSIDLDTYKKVLEQMNKVNTKEAKDLTNFYNIAKNNEKAYYRLSKLYNIVYNETLHWIHSSKDKVKIKNTDEARNAA